MVETMQGYKCRRHLWSLAKNYDKELPQNIKSSIKKLYNNTSFHQRVWF